MSFDIESWPVGHQVDWHLVRDQMNGMDFNIRVQKTWLPTDNTMRQQWGQGIYSDFFPTPLYFIFLNRLT